MEEQKEKRVLNIELSDEVKRVSITGKNGDEQVVPCLKIWFNLICEVTLKKNYIMEEKDEKKVVKQELEENDLNQASGGRGGGGFRGYIAHCRRLRGL